MLNTGLIINVRIPCYGEICSFHFNFVELQLCSWTAVWDMPHLKPCYEVLLPLHLMIHAGV